jgi:hypothetical protein
MNPIGLAASAAKTFIRVHSCPFMVKNEFGVS